jgi:hypothetical protein
MAVFAVDPLDKNRREAVTVGRLMDKSSMARETAILFRLQLAEALLTDHHSKERDSDIDFAAQNLAEAPTLVGVCSIAELTSERNGRRTS